MIIIIVNKVLKCIRKLLSRIILIKVRNNIIGFLCLMIWILMLGKKKRKGIGIGREILEKGKIASCLGIKNNDWNGYYCIILLDIIALSFWIYQACPHHIASPAYNYIYCSGFSGFILSAYFSMSLLYNYLSLGHLGWKVLINY